MAEKQSKGEEFVDLSRLADIFVDVNSGQTVMSWSSDKADVATFSTMDCPWCDGSGTVVDPYEHGTPVSAPTVDNETRHTLVIEEGVCRACCGTRAVPTPASLKALVLDAHSGLINARRKLIRIHRIMAQCTCLGTTTDEEFIEAASKIDSEWAKTTKMLAKLGVKEMNNDELADVYSEAHLDPEKRELTAEHALLVRERAIERARREMRLNIEETAKLQGFVHGEGDDPVGFLAKQAEQDVEKLSNDVKRAVIAADGMEKLAARVRAQVAVQRERLRVEPPPIEVEEEKPQRCSSRPRCNKTVAVWDDRGKPWCKKHAHRRGLLKREKIADEEE